MDQPDVLIYLDVFYHLPNPFFPILLARAGLSVPGLFQGLEFREKFSKEHEGNSSSIQMGFQMLLLLLLRSWCPVTLPHAGPMY